MAQLPERIPVSLLTGFLGSGKTTLLNALLRDPAMANTAIIVNELGDIGLDNLLVTAGQTSAIDNMVLLNSGCLCCTVLNTFKETLAELYERRARGEIPVFQRVVVETTGLADPRPILSTLLRDSFIAHFYRLGGVIVTVDAQLGMSTLDHHPESLRQAAVAEILAVTKTDLTGGEIPSGLLTRLGQINPFANIVSVHAGKLPIALFHDLAAGQHDWLERADFELHEHAHGQNHAHHDSNIRAESFIISGEVSWSGLSAWIEFVRAEFGDKLLRCKGLIEISEARKPVVVQGVQAVFSPPQTLAAWPDSDHRSRLVCISQGLAPGLMQASLKILHSPAGTYRPDSVRELLATAST